MLKRLFLALSLIMQIPSYSQDPAPEILSQPDYAVTLLAGSGERLQLRIIEVFSKQDLRLLLDQMEPLGHQNLILAPNEVTGADQFPGLMKLRTLLELHHVSYEDMITLEKECLAAAQIIGREGASVPLRAILRAIEESRLIKGTSAIVILPVNNPKVGVEYSLDAEQMLSQLSVRNALSGVTNVDNRQKINYTVAVSRRKERLTSWVVIDQFDLHAWETLWEDLGVTRGRWDEWRSQNAGLPLLPQFPVLSRLAYADEGSVSFDDLAGLHADCLRALSTALTTQSMALLECFLQAVHSASESAGEVEVYPSTGEKIGGHYSFDAAANHKQM